MKKIKLSVILPTYNEAKNLQVMIPEIEQIIERKWRPFEIIVVDDSSPDGTAKQARKLNGQHGNIRVIERRNREGIGAALREGYDKALGDIIFSIDSDGSISPKYINILLNKLEKGFDLVVGSKWGGNNTYHDKTIRKKIQKIISKAGNSFIAFMIGMRLMDYTMNCRAIRRKFWKKLRTVEKKNVFLLEMIIDAHERGGKIAGIPVFLGERLHGKSKVKILEQAPPFIWKSVEYAIKKRIL
jgi:dolichol-phosphate mannosyltransferase